MRREELTKPREARDASGLSVGIAVSEWNADVTEALLDGALEALAEWGVKDENIAVFRVPGSFELPYAIARLHSVGGKDALIALGCIVKGETEHDRHIASAVFGALADFSVTREVPVGLGILTTNDLDQALARAEGEGNAGRGAAFAALTLALS